MSRPASQRSPPILRADRIYIYAGIDGVTRQRCGRHVHREPWGRPAYIWHVLRPGRRHSCLECYYEKLGQIEEWEDENEAVLSGS